MDILNILSIKSKNEHYLNKYVKFIQTRTNIKTKETHVHHICPKAKDMYPEYAKTEENLINLTFREHFIAHWMLSKIFPGTSQTLAFYYMCNYENRLKNSKLYAEGRCKHLESLYVLNSNSERNKKISKALKGKPKSIEHRRKIKKSYDRKKTFRRI